MDQHKKRRTSVVSRATSRVTDLDDDVKSTTSTFRVRPEPGILIRVIELCSDSLVEHYLEFEAHTILIRAIDGSDQPGAIIGAVSSVSSNVYHQQPSELQPNVQAIFYSDTSFFHVVEGDATLLICTPAVPGKRYIGDLHRLVEQTLKTQCKVSPLMFATVKCTYSCQLALNEHLASRGSGNSVSTSGAAIPSAVRGNIEYLNGAAQGRAHGNNEKQSENVDTSAGSSVSSTMMNDFCLLFHQSAPQATLVAMLRRMHRVVETSDVPTRVGPQLTSFLRAIPPLFEVVWMSLSNSEVCAHVADVLTTIVCRLSGSSVQFLFSQNGASECVSILISMLRYQKGATNLDPKVHICLAMMFSLVSPIDCSKELRHNSSSGVADYLHASQTLTLSLGEAIRSIVEDVDVRLSATRDAGSASAIRRLRQFSRSLDTATSQRSAAKDQTPQYHYSASSQRSYMVFRVLWSAFPSALAFISTAIDDSIASLAHSTLSYHHEMLKTVLSQLLTVVTRSLRAFINLSPTDLCDVLETAAPSINTYFRRIVSWGEFLELSPLWNAVMSQATAYTFVVGLAREIVPNHVSFVTHSWLARISIATSSKATTAFFSELHRLFQSFVDVFPSWELRHSLWHARISGVMRNISLLCNSIVVSSPSPSMALTCWETCGAIVDKFSAVVDQPLALQPRLELARLLIQDGNDILRDESTSSFLSTSQLPQLEECELLWDDYTSLRDLHVRKSGTSSPSLEPRQLVSTSDIGVFAIVLEYILPSLESEVLARRWNSLSVQLFEISHFLVGFGTPHALVAAFVDSGVTLSQRHEGISEASLTSISDRFCSESFVRLNLSSGWSLSSSLRHDHFLQDTSASNDLVTASTQSEGYRVDPLEETISILPRRRKYESNLLQKIVVTYKNV
jgi:hypothetical protein